MTAALPMSLARFDSSWLSKRDAIDRRLDRGIEQLHDQDEQDRCQQHGLAGCRHGSNRAIGISTAARRTSWRNASSRRNADEKPWIE